jgi:endonuclease YncB( thermonuclease family)
VRVALGCLAVVLVGAACEDLPNESGAGQAAAPSPAAVAKPRDRAPEPAVGTPTPSAAPSQGPAADPWVTAGTVTAVVDGDTLDVDGQRVRLIGMDTPEVGACGYDEATATLASLVTGQTVTLTAVAGRDDTDRYGRLLRYVEVAGTDVGLRQIELGLGVARYDGRDGYGEHPRQELYVTADAAAADVTCAPPVAAPAPAAPAPLVGPAGGGSCDAAYPTVCIPPPPPDLDCGDIGDRRFTVLAPDPHNFDGDRDGVGCESG